MITKITNGIANAINKEFGDDYEIYVERAEQDLHEPCFSIICLNPASTKFINNRYLRTNLFIIQYFPKTHEVKTECADVIERLYQCLEIIELENDGKIRGSEMNAEIIDDVLNFNINYNLFVTVKEDEKIKMENLEQSTNAKE